VVKYRHTIFDDDEVKKLCAEELRAGARAAGACIVEIGFDLNHVHFVLDTDLQWLPDVVKSMKGRSGRHVFTAFPKLKMELFWGSGLWSPAYFFESVGRKTLEFSRGYVRSQGSKAAKRVVDRSQTRLTAFA
jgi:REP element-mobilizing transposase RayT